MKIRLTPGNHSIAGAFVFALVSLFALMALLVVMTGVQGYRSVVDASRKTADRRAALNYVVNKTRSADAAGAVAVRDYGGVCALVLSEEIEGEIYETRVFAYDGALREQLTAANTPFDPEDAQALTPAASMEILSANDNLFLLTIGLADGETCSTHFALRAG